MFQPGFLGKALVPLTFAHTDDSGQSGFATVWNFNSQAIGTAAADRYILVSTISANIAQVPSGVTVGGVAATSVAGGRFWLVAFPSGTTANVVVTYAANASFVYIGVTAIYGPLNTTPFDAQSSGSVTTNPRTININTAAGGVVVCFDVNTNNATASSLAWSGVTERFEFQQNGSPTAHVVGGGSLGFAAAQIVAVSVTRSGGDGSGLGRLEGVSFAPL